MAKNIFWNPELADKYLEAEAMNRLVKAAEAMADEVRKNTPIGTEERPMYKTGPYAGVYWTARDNGELQYSVRVTTSRGKKPTHYRGQHDDWGVRFNRNVWILCGNTKAYYGKIVEYGTNGNKHKGFFRKAMNRSKSKATSILQGA